MSNQKSRLNSLANDVRRNSDRLLTTKNVLGFFTFDEINPGVKPETWRVVWKHDGTDIPPVCMATCIGPNAKRMAGDLAVKMNEFLVGR